jgi:transaldolase
MTSKLEQLRAMTTVVADTGDMEAIRAFKPTDCTTNPTLILKAAQMPAYSHLVDEAIEWGKSHRAVTSQVTDRLAVNFGAELTRIVPGRVSTEVDADLSFDTQGSLTKARALIADYESRGISRDSFVFKLGNSWERISAALVLHT